jgi:hypothetical protein
MKNYSRKWATAIILVMTLTYILPMSQGVGSLEAKAGGLGSVVPVGGIHIVAPTPTPIASLRQIPTEVPILRQIPTEAPILRQIPTESPIVLLPTPTPKIQRGNLDLITPAPIALPRDSLSVTPVPTNAQDLSRTEAPLLNKGDAQLGWMGKNLERVDQNKEPASLNSTYVLKKNVIPLHGELNTLLEQPGTDEVFNQLLPQEKIDSGVLVNTNLLKKSIPQAKDRAIVFDTINHLAAKVVDRSKDPQQATALSLVKPQIAEIVEDIHVNPEHKKIFLNAGNLGYSERNKAVIKQGALLALNGGASTGTNADSTPNAMHVMSGSAPVAPPLVYVTIPKGTKYSATTADGMEVEVELSGYFKIASLEVYADYGFMSGYEISFQSGLDMNMSANFTAAHGVVRVPLYGISIPAGVANISGGIFLTIGVDGKISLGLDANASLNARAGVAGGTFCGVPTSIHPIAELNVGFGGSASLSGDVRGSITVGPFIGINVFGFDIVSANIGIGAGLDCKPTPDGAKYLDCEVYGCLQASASLFGEGVTLADQRISLYHFRKENTMNYTLDFYDIDAYLKHVSGKLQYDFGKKAEPVVKGKFKLVVERAVPPLVLNGDNEKRAPFIPVSVDTDENGQFNVDLTQELYFGDKVFIIEIENKVKNEIEGKLGATETPNFPKKDPTIPFTKPVLKYADFYNEKIKGEVAPGYYNNKVTNEEKPVYYSGRIELEIKPLRTIGKTVRIPAQSDYGKFYKEYMIMPNFAVRPILMFNGFEIYGDFKETDTDFVGTRVTINEKINEDVKNGQMATETLSTEYFFIKNMRGSKQLEMKGIYIPLHYTTYYVNCPALQMLQTEITTEKNFYRWIKPYTSEDVKPVFNFSPNGGLTHNLALFQDPDIGGTSLVETNFRSLPHAKDTAETSKLSADPKISAPEDGSENLELITCNHMIGKIQVKIKGETIEIKDPNDVLPDNSKKTPGMALGNPLDRLLIDKIWSHVNPNPVTVLGIVDEKLNQGVTDTKGENETINLQNESERLQEIKGITSIIKANVMEQASYDKAAQVYTKQKDTTIKVFANGNIIDFNKYDGVFPIISNGRTLIPIRALSESLGATVDWNAGTQLVTIVLDGHTIKLTLNSSKAYVDGVQKMLDVSASSIGGRVMVPMRFVGEGFSKKVDWHGQVGAGGVISVVGM